MEEIAAGKKEPTLISSLGFVFISLISSLLLAPFKDCHSIPGCWSTLAENHCVRNKILLSVYSRQVVKRVGREGQDTTSAKSSNINYLKKRVHALGKIFLDIMHTMFPVYKCMCYKNKKNDWEKNP